MISLPALTSERLYLRAIDIHDADLIEKWATPKDSWVASGIYAPIGSEDIRRYIEHTSQSLFSYGHLCLMIVLNDATPIGYIEIFNYDNLHRRGEIGIIIDQDYQQSGYASEALAIIESYFFYDLRQHHLIAMVKTENKAAINLFTDNDFRLVGVIPDYLWDFRKYCDVSIFSKLAK